MTNLLEEVWSWGDAFVLAQTPPSLGGPGFRCDYMAWCTWVKPCGPNGSIFRADTVADLLVALLEGAKHPSPELVWFPDR